MSVTIEIVMMWSAVTMYALGAVLYVTGFVFSLPKVNVAALFVSVSGLLPHLAAVAVRWVRSGHGPYLGFYEVVSSFAFVSILVLGLLVWRNRAYAPAGLVITPLAFLLLGAAMFTPKADLPINAKLASWWLAIHVMFAKLTYAAFIASFVLALLYLLHDRIRRGVWADVFAKLPRQEVVDDLSFKFIAAGFIFLGIMIAAGAVWANEAWGSYWSWDPIETWSLISWIVYAVYLHARLTLGWRGRKAAWLAVAALPVVVFALIGVPVVYHSIHGAYLTGY